MPPKRLQFSLNPLWPHYLSWACVGIAVALGLIRYGILGTSATFQNERDEVEAAKQTDMTRSIAMPYLRMVDGWTRTSGTGSPTVCLLRISMSSISAKLC